MSQDQKPRILIVDDDIVSRITISKVLRNQGYNYLEAFDFHTALSMLKTIHFDMVITDNNMSGMSGMDLLTVIKQKWPEMAVIIVADTSKFSVVLNCIKKGAADYIAKPYDLVKLAQSIRRILETRAEQVEAPSEAPAEVQVDAPAPAT